MPPDPSDYPPTDLYEVVLRGPDSRVLAQLPARVGAPGDMGDAWSEARTGMTVAVAEVWHLGEEMHEPQCITWCEAEFTVIDTDVPIFMPVRISFGPAQDPVFEMSVVHDGSLIDMTFIRLTLIRRLLTLLRYRTADDEVPI